MKKVLTVIFLLIFAVAIGFAVVMISISESTSVLDLVTPTDAVKAANASGGEIFELDPEIAISYDGYMRCYTIVWIPEAKELQVSVKSNNSTYEKLGATKADGYDFMLYDVASETEYRTYTEEREYEGRYSYFRLVFEGVEFDENVSLELIMFPKGKETPYSYFMLHESGEELKTYKLSKEEIALLGE